MESRTNVLFDPDRNLEFVLLNYGVGASFNYEFQSVTLSGNI